MSDFSPDPARFGDVLGRAFVAFVDAIQTSEELDRKWLRETVSYRSGVQPKTVSNMIVTLSKFGLLHVGGTRHERISLTTLGRRWLGTDQAQELLARWST